MQCRDKATYRFLRWPSPRAPFSGQDDSAVDGHARRQGMIHGTLIASRSCLCSFTSRHSLSILCLMLILFQLTGDAGRRNTGFKKCIDTKNHSMPNAVYHSDHSLKNPAASWQQAAQTPRDGQLSARFVDTLLQKTSFS